MKESESICFLKSFHHILGSSKCQNRIFCPFYLNIKSFASLRLKMVIMHDKLMSVSC